MKTYPQFCHCTAMDRPLSGAHLSWRLPLSLKATSSGWPSAHSGPCLLQVDPSVNAVVHFVRSQYFKHKKDFAEFYKSSLLYLAYISSEALPEEQKLVGIGTPCPAYCWHCGGVLSLRGILTTPCCPSCLS